MPRNGAGTYSLPAGNPVVTNTTISSTWANNTLSDIGTALTQSLTKDGQTTSTANQPMGGFKFTGLGSGSAATDSINLGQAQSSASQMLAAVSGTNTITASLNPTLTAYTSGQTFRFVASASNTGAVTININGLGAKSITRNGTTALITGDILINALYEITYDGTQFQIVNSSLGFQGGTVPNATTFTSPVQVNNDVYINGGTLRLTKGADVASATALPLITDGNYFDVTGTTTITSFNSVGVGTQVVLKFNGILTLTHNATDLILPSGANITTAAGDVAGFVEYASGDYRCLWYTKANGLSVAGGITASTVVATTSGTSIDFGNGSNGVTFPTTTKRVTMMFNVVSTSGTSVPIIQLGDSGGIENTGYTALGGSFAAAGSTGVLSSTAGFPITNTTAATDTYSGTVVFTLLDSANNTWTASGSLNKNGTTVASTQGVKSTSATFDRIRLTTVGGTDTFDAGSVSIFYES